MDSIDLRGKQTPRLIGFDELGRTQFAFTTPGGVLERYADAKDVGQAHSMLAFVTTLVAEESASDVELAAMVRPLVDSLAKVLDIVERRAA